MSDSDDTDLLLLIPPDFFAVNSSDSDDSITPIRSNSFRHFQFNKLISQVNELKERVNLIESKDHISSENLSEASRLNHSADYSVSFDSSKYHNICRSDLALRFYSLTSTGFTFGNRSNSDGQDFEPYIMNSCSNSVMPFEESPMKGVLGKNGEGSNYLINSAEMRGHSNDPSQILYNATSNRGFGNNNIVISNSQLSTSDFCPEFTPMSHQNISFLKEIDEYLASKDSGSYLSVRPVSQSDSENKNGKREGKTNESTSDSFDIVNEAKSLVVKDDKNVGLDEVDQLLSQVEAAHFEMKHKLHSSFRDSSTLKTQPETSDEKYYIDYTKDMKQHSVNESIGKVKEYINNVENLACQEISPEELVRPYRSYEQLGKQSGKLNEYFKTSVIATSSNCQTGTNQKLKSLNPKVNSAVSSSQNSCVSSREDNLTLGKNLRTISENFHETSISTGCNKGQDSASQFNEAVRDLADLRKSQGSENNHFSKQFVPYKHTEEQLFPKIPLPNVHSETVSNNYTNTESVSGHTSEQTEGTTKTTRLQDDGYYSSQGGGSCAANLFSLSDLWGRDMKGNKGMNLLTVEQKLQEEHCRRKHCENLIQELQCTILEQQQKLAVAVKVDQSKDYTIHQLQSAWKRLASHWQELEDQRNALSIQCSEEKEKYQRDTSEMKQKIKWYESELSKALNIAHSYKEKNDALEQKLVGQEKCFFEEKKALEVSLLDMQNNFVTSEKKLGSINNEMIALRKKLEVAEQSVYKEKDLAVKAQSEVKCLKNSLEKLKTDLSSTREENTTLHSRLKEEKIQIETGSKQIKDLQAALDDSKKKQKSLEVDVKDKISLLERTKNELRDYYQKQLEFVVQEKLVEFQTQLDAAEVSLHQEMEQREKMALQTANKQIKLLTEKNLLEVKLLEEKHKEELHLHKLQLTQAMHQIGQLQSQLQSHSNHKVEIVEKLHSVMETQWQEALRIISGNSPVAQHFKQQNGITEGNMGGINIPNQERNIRSINIPNQEMKNTNSNKDCNNIPFLPVACSSASSTTDEEPFNKDNQLTYRPSTHIQTQEEGSLPADNPDLIKKYIQMLLSRPPGNPTNLEVSDFRDSGEEPVCEGRSFQKWEKIMENQRILQSEEKQILENPTGDVKYTRTYNKDCKSNKPPWK